MEQSLIFDSKGRRYTLPDYCLRFRIRRILERQDQRRFARCVRSIWACLFAMFALACASPERSVYVSDSAPSLVAPTRAAMKAWNYGLRQLCPEVQLVTSINRDTADIVVYWGIVDGYETYDGVERAGMIRINPAEIRPDEQARLTVTIGHELGHALGVEHSTSTRDLMHIRSWAKREPNIETQGLGPTTNDIARACDVWTDPRIVIAGDT